MGVCLFSVLPVRRTGKLLPLRDPGGSKPTAAEMGREWRERGGIGRPRLDLRGAAL